MMFPYSTTMAEQLPIIRLDLPPPPSVNRTRKVHWPGERRHRRWIAAADALVTAQKRGPLPSIDGPYEIVIALREDAALDDIDNGIKAVVDYMRRLGIVVNDNRARFRRLVVELGNAPEGCRVFIYRCG